MPSPSDHLFNSNLVKLGQIDKSNGQRDEPYTSYRPQTKAQLEDLREVQKFMDNERAQSKRPPEIYSYSTRWDAQKPDRTEICQSIAHPLVDVDLVLAWIKTCEARHADHCRATSAELLDSSCRPLWLIDTHRRSLKRAEPSDQYLALSYVWGVTGDSLMACKDNIDYLQRDGALNDTATIKRIPRTIRDALAFTKLIGQTYLWVDRLCIIQDDNAAKQGQIDSMAAIYTNAYLTLVATIGSGADYGLRGVSKDLTYVKDRSARNHHFLIRNSLWNTRGWTLQEMVFSRRAIFFHDHMVTWECHCAVWEELQPNGEVTSKYKLVLPPWKCKERFSDIGSGLQHRPWPDLEDYARLAFDFSLRQLTFSDDTFPAFSGIMCALSHKFQGGFTYGLPDLFFDAALLWTPQMMTTTKKEASTATQIPSWSWMGWSGPFDFKNWASSYDYAFSLETGSKPRGRWPKTSLKTKPILQWRSMPTKESKIYKTIKHWTLTEAKNKARNAPSEHLPGKWQFNKSTCMFHHSSDLSTQFTYPVPILESKSDNVEPISDTDGCLLSCQTSRARFKSSIWDCCCDLETSTVLCDTKGAATGVLRSQQIDLYRDQEFELIAISAGEVNIDDSPTCHSLDLQMFIKEAKKLLIGKCDDANRVCHFYNVLWVEWEDGIAHRKGLGRVLKDAWEREATEVDVILG